MMDKRVARIVGALHKRYPRIKTALDHTTPHQLLVATILSAQCTDDRVNKVTPALFKKYRNVEEFARARQATVEKLVRSAGFYRNKAKNIIASARQIVADHGGRVPDTMEELITLAGVSRKTANVILAHVFRKAEGIAVDTHVRRISRRLGLTENEDPVRIEQDLMRILPRGQWRGINSRLVFFGREVCKARKPACPVCELKDWCPSHRV